jgi:hypothetical protein
MRLLRLSLALLVILFALSLFDERRTSVVREITGDVVEWQAGQSITIVNDQTDPAGFRINLRATDYGADRISIKPGARVAVSYKSVGERYAVAHKVRVLDRQ